MTDKIFYAIHPRMGTRRSVVSLEVSAFLRSRGWRLETLEVRKDVTTYYLIYEPTPDEMAAARERLHDQGIPLAFSDWTNELLDGKGADNGAD